MKLWMIFVMILVLFCANACNRPPQQYRAVEFVVADVRATEGAVEKTLLNTNESFFLAPQPALTEQDISRVETIFDAAGKPAFSFEFTNQGSTKMLAATKANLGKHLAIVIDGKLISAPKIQSEISQKAMVTGNFSKEEMQDLYHVMVKPVP